MFFRKRYDSIDVTELNKMIKGNINLIDCRETYEYKSGHIKKAKNVPLMGLINNHDQFLDKDKKYYIVCQSGSRSSRACSKLAKLGYNVVNVSGGTGMFAYKHRENIA